MTDPRIREFDTPARGDVLVAPDRSHVVQFSPAELGIAETTPLRILHLQTVTKAGALARPAS